VNTPEPVGAPGDHSVRRNSGSNREAALCGPLTGLRVVDAAEFVTGPFATAMLGAMGADVIKVERPKGDSFRSFSVTHAGMSACWATVNHGKRSVILDLKKPENRLTFLNLIEGADVVVQNWRPKVARDLDLSDEVLAARNPKLIRLAITGYGTVGPLTHLPAFDSLVQARSGIMHPNSDDPPMAHSGYPIDKATGLYATQSILAALLARTRTGLGCRIDLAMLDAAAHYNLIDLFQDRVFPESAVRMRKPRSAVLETKDGFIVVAPVTGRQIGRTLEALGLSEHAATLKSAAHPNDLIDSFYGMIEPATRRLTTAELLTIFESHDVPAAPLLDGDQQFTDEQVVTNGVYEVVRDPRVGQMRWARYPAIFDGRRLGYPGPPPTLGDRGQPAWFGDETLP
jgi:crotonobetainyl-CoA:carnitine CoA-transferase CaiB-like acyl-CoA transferase